MGTNQIGDIEAGVLKTYVPTRSNDVDFFHGMPLRWGLAYMINLQPGPDGRSANSLTWAGIFNTYYWIDPSKHVTGVIMTQVLPFADQASVQLYGRFERGIYNALKST
jgi:CubicO group peptidase (beta-lactamase class C family)